MSRIRCSGIRVHGAWRLGTAAAVGAQPEQLDRVANLREPGLPGNLFRPVLDSLAIVEAEYVDTDFGAAYFVVGVRENVITILKNSDGMNLGRIRR